MSDPQARLAGAREMRERVALAVQNGAGEAFGISRPFWNRRECVRDIRAMPDAPETKEGHAMAPTPGSAAEAEAEAEAEGDDDGGGGSMPVKRG
jgi:hypothetical protein